MNVRGSTAPISLPIPQAPDADWETVRARVMSELALTAVTEWTDHNVPDPGVTLAEVAAFGLADLHFRIAESGFTPWPLGSRGFETEAERHWHATRPVRTESPGVTSFADALAAVVDELQPLVQRCATRTEADTLLGSSPWVASFPLATRPATVALLRGPWVRRIAQEHADLVSEVYDLELARDDAGGDASDRAAVHLADRLPLWIDECAALVRRERRRRAQEAIVSRAERLVTGTPAQVAAIVVELGQAGLTVAESDLAPALAPIPRLPAGYVLPEEYEHPDGSSRMWPPHGIQALTVEPVTAPDYARRARTHPEVVRAWAIGGRHAGIAWHGLPVVDGATIPQNDIRQQWRLDPGARAVTLVVERAGDGTDDEFLRDVLTVAVGTEVRDPFALWRADLDVLDPARVICDEVGAAYLKRIEVVVQATLIARVTVKKDDLVADVTQRVRTFFAEGRPESRPAPEARGIVSGPWPPAPQPALGWNPGEPIRFTEVIERIVANPDVVGVEDLFMTLATSSQPLSLADGELPLPPDAVPVLASGGCFTVKIEDLGGGDA